MRRETISEWGGKKVLPSKKEKLKVNLGGEIYELSCENFCSSLCLKEFIKKNKKLSFFSRFWKLRRLQVAMEEIFT